METRKDFTLRFRDTDLKCYINEEQKVVISIYSDYDYMSIQIDNREDLSSLIKGLEDLMSKMRAL